MAYELPPHFSEDLNHLGALIRLCDDTRKEETRRDHLLAGMKSSCLLLTELWKAREELANGVDRLDVPSQAATKLATEHRDLFRRIEDLILRDAGIDRITRKIMLGNLRFAGGLSRGDVREFSGSELVGTLRNLMAEVCERAKVLEGDPEKMRKRLGAVVTFGLPPINIAVSVLHPVFLPVVFKASSWAGTMASKVILWL
jgi:hypothetical protein